MTGKPESPEMRSSESRLCEEHGISVQPRLDPKRPPVVPPVAGVYLAVQVSQPPGYAQVRVALLVGRPGARARAALRVRDGLHDLLQGDPVRRQEQADLVRRVDQVREARVGHLQLWTPPAC